MTDSFFTVLYKDKHLIAVIKPKGILSQYSESEQNMPSLIKKQFQADYVGTVHRLDKNVSGVMIYSLDERITGKLCGSFSDKNLAEKEYLAEINGVPEDKNGMLSDLLFHDKILNKTFVVKNERKGVKPASLFYTVISCNGNTSLVKVKLYTGRTHQIRVQFSSRGMSVIGDGKYGGGKGSICLWSYRIAFKHPVSNKPLDFTYIPEIITEKYGKIAL